MVMLTEGVHSGSAGPLLYPKDELSKLPEVWNHKPVVVYHPQRNGAGISACEPAVLNSRKVGVILNTKFDGRLAAEAWIDVEKAKQVDDRILPRIEKGEMMELSTGLWAEHEDKDGEWNGEAYKAVARNYRPDHLALLPDQLGACSIADGAGLLRNEVSFDAVRDLVQAALREEYGEDTYCYVLDVFRDFFVYSMKGKLHKQDYTASDTKATLTGEAQEVVRVIQYRTADGAVVANKEESYVNKAALIALLVSNGLFLETEKPWLEKQEESRLQQFAVQIKTNKKEEAPKSEAEKPPVTENKAPKGEILQLNAEVKKSEEEETRDYIAKAPPKIRGMLANSLRTYEAQKAGLVKQLLANSRNVFTAEQLQAKDVDELKAIAQLAEVPAAPKASTATYGGLADAFAGNQAPSTEEPLEAPSLSFEKR
jgi:hypothetical protein